MKLDCNGDWLVEYADDALDLDQARAAESHLAHCPACMNRLAALRKSSAMLETYFTHAADIHIAPPTRRAAISCRAGVAVAAVAAVVLLALFARPWMQGGIDQPVAHQPNPIAAPEIVRPAAPDLASIEADIARAEQIARLRATMKILAEEGLTERHAVLAAYLLDEYGVRDTEPPAM